jgi:hypothetical protein
VRVRVRVGVHGRAEYDSAVTKKLSCLGMG